MLNLGADPTSLEDQIRSKWGQYGEWDAAGVDRVAELAKLLRANGIEDISQIGVADTEYDTPASGYWEGGDAGHWVDTPAGKGKGFQLTYGDRRLGFLGDVNDDGSVAKVGERDRIGGPEGAEQLSNLVGWSANGHGNTRFHLGRDKDGNVFIAPEWASSSDAAFSRQGLLALAATLGGGYLAAAGQGANAASTAATTAAPAGQATNWSAIAANAGKGALINGGMTAVRGGSLSDILESAVIGGVGGGAGAYGGQMGWNPALTGAAVSGGTTALRGGDIEDIARSAGAGAFGGYVKTEGLTGNPAVDRAIAAGGGTLIRGGDGKGILSSALQAGLDGTLRNSAAGRDNVSFDQGGDDAADQEGEGSMASPYDDAYSMDEWGPSYDPAPDYGNEGSRMPTDHGYGLDDAVIDPRAGIRGQDGYGDSPGMTGRETESYDNWMKFMDSVNGVTGWAGNLVKDLFGGLNSRDWASLGLGGLNAVAQSKLLDRKLAHDDEVYKRNRADQLADEERRRGQTVADREDMRAYEERLRQERFQRMKPVTDTGLMAPAFRRTGP